MQPPRKSENGKNTATREQRGKIIAFLEKNRGKAQYRPTPSAGLAINRVLRPLSKKFGPGAGALKSHWPQIVGEKWAKLSVPTAIRGSKDGKTLLITAQGPAATLIQANSGQLLDKINNFLGDGAISKLRVQQGSISMFKPVTDFATEPAQSENHVQSTLDQDGDDDLQKALKKLGRKISDRNTV
jgi:hypothetical protein